MKMIIAVISSSLLFASPLFSQDKATHLDLALEFLDYTAHKEQFGALIKINQISATTPEAKKKLEALSWDKIKTQLAPFVVEVYTAEELKKINSFYRTPEGKSLLLKKPLLDQKMMMTNLKIAEEFMKINE